MPDATLGSVSDWDGFLQLDLNQPELPFKSADEYVLNEDFHRLVVASKLPRPSKFVDQSIAFGKALCKQLMEHEIVNSGLVKGLSAFDPAVILDGPESHYITAIEKLSSHFVSMKLITSSDKAKVISQYRSFAIKLRSEAIPAYSDWIHFLSAHHEIQCRPELLRLYNLSCLCLPPLVDIPPEFTVPMPKLAVDAEMFDSCLRSLQMSYSTVPHVSSLYKDPKSVCRVFRLLGRGSDLLVDKKFSVWNFLKGSGPRRTAMLGKMEAEYRKAVLHYDRPVVTSNTTTPSVSRASSTHSTPSPDLSLGRVNVSLSRCANVSPKGTVKKNNTKIVKGKKN